MVFLDVQYHKVVASDRGTPLPLLFVLAIDPLHHILQKATEQGKLHPLDGNADDAAVFLAPIKSKVKFFAETIACFGEVTGLITNCSKSMVVVVETRVRTATAITQTVRAGSRTAAWPMAVMEKI